mmetsp:Transcript_15429/g.25213  ORF Transcript_15429/g.25213 Transcript_15429/m.25213 type:complete len:91 (-) Transcript_15429:1337-1609(-)
MIPSSSQYQVPKRQIEAQNEATSREVVSSLPLGSKVYCPLCAGECGPRVGAEPVDLGLGSSSGDWGWGKQTLRRRKFVIPKPPLIVVRFR